LVTALAVPYSAHWSRQLLNELAGEMQQREKAQAEWGRLVLEQSTWTAHSRVESIATRQLGMRVPEPSEVILVRQCSSPTGNQSSIRTTAACIPGASGS